MKDEKPRTRACRFCGGPIPVTPVDKKRYGGEKVYCSDTHRKAFHTMTSLNKKSASLKASRDSEMDAIAPKKPKYKSGIGKRRMLYSLREEIFKLDGGKCVYCGAAAYGIDHIIPTTSGDCVNDETNLVAACVGCNSVARNLRFDSFLKKLRYIKSERGL